MQQFDFSRPMFGSSWGQQLDLGNRVNTAGYIPMGNYDALPQQSGGSFVAPQVNGSLSKLGNGPNDAPWYDRTNLLGGTRTDSTGAKITDQGSLMPALGLANGAFNVWMGMKQYGLAKDQLAEGRQQFALNYDAQRTTTNSQLQDRQAARVASNPGAYQSVGTYMDANGIKPRGG